MANRRRAIQSIRLRSGLRLRLHSGLRQQGKGFYIDLSLGLRPRLGICRPLALGEERAVGLDVLVIMWLSGGAAIPVRRSEVVDG